MPPTLGRFFGGFAAESAGLLGEPYLRAWPNALLCLEPVSGRVPREAVSIQERCIVS